MMSARVWTISKEVAGAKAVEIIAANQFRVQYEFAGSVLYKILKDPLVQVPSLAINSTFGDQVIK